MSQPTTAQKKTALTNVRVFDGKTIGEPTTVVIDGSIIGTDTTGAEVVDGGGAVLLPGLIDAHVHLHGPENLEALSRWGVTTALDMAIWPLELLTSLRGRVGVTDIRSSGLPATSPGSSHSRFLPKECELTGPEDGKRFVADRVAEGSDYIKIVADIPGPSQETLNAIIEAAHQQGKLTVAHAAIYNAYDIALKVKIDLITQSPLDKSLDDALVDQMLKQATPTIPTLIMMKGMAVGMAHVRPGIKYDYARDSVTRMYRAGVPIIAGTDANAQPGSPSPVRHGESMHDELELLVDAGLSTLDALRAATVLAAQHFGLNDRGVIEPGRRADLLLIDGNPLQDIRATRKIQGVWCAGIECAYA
ncbi:hypothetical protein BZG36_00640 [Bifiguratus adelaidae]|uniref:Amidohydrolase-related domain-containing protein n=1 Tax=Bifiguratus adelaidae TaxID=1938954 RepID=A0A261Y805_9FUNG|nr:hypothetical protein BZG36_00640 [Bifiguratus adelaidae]